MKRFLALLALLLVLPMSAHAWWNAEWKFRKKVTLDTTSLVGEAADVAENVPVAVRLHSGNFLFTDAKPDGSDIRFVAGDDKTPLKHHVEMFVEPHVFWLASKTHLLGNNETCKKDKQLDESESIISGGSWFHISLTLLL